jgi:hypothetical protein
LANLLMIAGQTESEHVNYLINYLIAVEGGAW